MFWQKQPQVASIIFKNDSRPMLLTFSSMVCGNQFIVFKKGTMQKTVDSPAIPYKQFYLCPERILSLTVV